MLSAEECRKFAEECVRLAQEARSHQRAALLGMAETWLMLADEAERLRRAMAAPKSCSIDAAEGAGGAPPRLGEDRSGSPGESP